ncbi:hypothetical protein ABDJ41_21405 [Pedobacter sp. ASV1-7]|uniref:hypothetical protein n=1 Tax=Pedobacter sp. ASV1-7 TaxID=3145237 RepID=UPI0032E8BDBB
MRKLKINNLSFVLTMIALCLVISSSFGQHTTHGTEDNLKIGIFWPPSWAHTNDMQYKRLHEAKVDVIQNTTSTDLARPERNKKMLDLALKYKMLVSVADSLIYGNLEDSKTFINRYKEHPALFGYYIKDEPTIAELEGYAKKYKELLSLDIDHVPYLNLFPNFGVEGDYDKEYVERWIELVGAKNLKYLSFDHYPFKPSGEFAPRYFENLESIRRAGIKYNVKTSSYLHSMGIRGSYRRPNVAELRYSVYSNLAYGIKMPVWFTYYTPTSLTEDFMDSIVARDGTLTDLYAPFKVLNGEIKALGKTLVSLEAEAVYHIGSEIPKGTPKMPADFEWKPVSNQDLIVTLFRSKNSTETYLMIVNKSFEETSKFSMNIAKSVDKVSEIDNKNGRKKSLSYNKATNVFADTLLPGGGKLYVLQTN